MFDPYLSKYNVVMRLIDEYRLHKNLVIAFDFDNTIYDFHGNGDTFPRVVKLLKDCSDFGLTMVCYTGNSDEALIRFECDYYGIRIDYINESPIKAPSKPHKPYFSILLDDRCGLRSTVEDLNTALEELRHYKG